MRKIYLFFISVQTKAAMELICYIILIYRLLHIYTNLSQEAFFF